jgi:hypothetical protein
MPMRTSTGVTTRRADSADVAATAICRSSLAPLAGFTVEKAIAGAQGVKTVRLYR